MEGRVVWGWVGVSVERVLRSDVCGNNVPGGLAYRRMGVARQSDEHVEGSVLGDAVLFRENVDGLGDDFARSQVSTI